MTGPVAIIHGDDPDVVIVPAATLVVFRDILGEPAELLMVERGASMAFAAGATVFPGGRVDDGDHLLAASLGGEAEDTAARIAAVRETIEECGIPVALVPMPSPAILERMRRALHDGASIGAVLTDAGCTIDPSLLVAFARWRPAHRHARLFDTRFFLARLPAAAPPARVDGTENRRLAWMSARATLDAAAEGRATIIFPTRRNLERLARFASFDEAAAHARATPLRTVTPWVETRGEEDYLCIPDDLGYPVTAERAAIALRG